VLKITESYLHERFPWSKPIIPELTEQEKAEGYFVNSLPWDFDESIMKLLMQMFLEIESFFTKKNMPVEVAIFGVYRLFGELRIEMFSPWTEVYEIVNKYIKFSRDVFDRSDD